MARQMNEIEIIDELVYSDIMFNSQNRGLDATPTDLEISAKYECNSESLSDRLWALHPQGLKSPGYWHIYRTCARRIYNILGSVGME